MTKQAEEKILAAEFDEFIFRKKRLGLPLLAKKAGKGSSLVTLISNNEVSTAHTATQVTYCKAVRAEGRIFTHILTSL